jgi:transposase
MVEAPSYIGADVAKDTIEVAYANGTPAPLCIDNRRTAISAWLRNVPRGTPLALEATGPYHELLCTLAHRGGLLVYLLNPKRTRHYLQAMSPRAKTDRVDAPLIATFLANEQPRLRRWTPPLPSERRAWVLLRRRAKLVNARQRLEQSLAGPPSLRSTRAALLAELERALGVLDTQLARLLAQDPAHANILQDLQSIVGVGPLTSSALLLALKRGTFATSDAFIAFLGLDLRVRDSGNETASSAGASRTPIPPAPPCPAPHAQRSTARSDPTRPGRALCCPSRTP